MNLIVLLTIIITASLTVLTQKTTQKVLRVIFKPIIYLKECIYKWIAPRNPFSISLKSYKKHVRRSNLAKIENPVGPSLDVPLEQAYAPLKLISSQTYENVELFTHAAEHYRSIVLGGPGTGKTTLMKSLLMNIINKKCHLQLDKLIPVFIVLRKLAAKKHTVEDAIVEAFKDYHFPGAEKFVTSALDQGRMLIIFDGLDEVSLNREYVASQIREFCQHDEQREHKNRVLVTCRENSYRNEDLRDVIPTVVRVEAFANHHMRIFLKGWPLHKGRAAIKLYGMIQNDSQIRDICRNPLLLTILTGLYLDDDKFEVPKSRDSFYRNCIDELLSKRPARKEIIQVIHPDDKRKILERVCLERLETTGIDDDPEELTFDSIIQNAQKVLQKEFDKRGLIKELVEINSIIKPLVDDTYTCTHRTIQEYLAAREARRIRVPDEVIERFGNREDLIEVMYFYCGLLNNIPQLNSIAEKFTKRDKWNEAGRCVLNMTEVIDEKHIDTIAKNLLNLVKKESKFEISIEVLSSLAQRTNKSFDIARISLVDAIDFLAATDDESGASALESVLSSSPEEAMKVIPGLLHHPSSRWKNAAIKLLSDIGTDEALDQLVRLLESEDKIVHSGTARTLANLIKTRGEDLKARENFLPKKEDLKIWPLEKYFPGSLAIPIINSLIDYDGKSNNKAINSAVQIIKTKNEGDKDILFLKKWKKLPIHLDLIQHRKQIGAKLNLLGSFFIVVFILFSLMIPFLTSSESLIIINFRPIKIYKIRSDLFKKFDEMALSIVSEIEKKFPPNTSGFSQFLPWNWKSKPNLQDGKVEVFEILKKFSEKSFNYKNFKDLNNLFPLSTDLVSKEKSDSLQKVVKAIDKKLPNLRNDSYICSRGGWSKPLSVPILFILIITVLYRHGDYSLRKLTKKEFEKKRREMGKYYIWLPKITFIPYLVIWYFYVSFSFGESIFIYSILGLIIMLPNVIGVELANINFPKNPFIDVIEDLQPVSSTIDGLEPGEDEALKNGEEK